MSNSYRDRRRLGGDVDPADEDRHLEAVEDGCGCVEVWEHLSRRRHAE